MQQRVLIADLKRALKHWHDAASAPHVASAESESEIAKPRTRAQMRARWHAGTPPTQARAHIRTTAPVRSNERARTQPTRTRALTHTRARTKTRKHPGAR